MRSFFASDVIIVEGDTEATVLRTLIASLDVEKEIFVLNSGSKMNIPMFQKILTHFGIRHHVIHDSDIPYVLDNEGKIVKNKDGSPRGNSAWTMNEEIWKLIEFANSKEAGLANRYVNICNFEDAHGYEFDARKGKPLSAYHFAKTINIDDNIPICNMIREIIGLEDRKKNR